MDYMQWKRRKLALDGIKKTKSPLGAGWQRCHILSAVQTHAMDWQGQKQLKEAGYTIVDDSKGAWSVLLQTRQLAKGNPGQHLAFNNGEYFPMGENLARRASLGGVGSPAGGPKAA